MRRKSSKTQSKDTNGNERKKNDSLTVLPTVSMLEIADVVLLNAGTIPNPSTPEENNANDMRKCEDTRLNDSSIRVHIGVNNCKNNQKANQKNTKTKNVEEENNLTNAESFCNFLSKNLNANVSGLNVSPKADQEESNIMVNSKSFNQVYRHQTDNQDDAKTSKSSISCLFTYNI